MPSSQRRSPRRRNAIIVAVCLVLGFTGTITRAEAGEQPRTSTQQVAKHPSMPRQCRTDTPRHALTVAITTPKAGAQISLADQPLVEMSGTIRGNVAGYVRAVELYAAGKSIGAASVDPKPARDGTRQWTLKTPAPPGRHSVVACVRTWIGVSAIAEVTFTVQAPSPAETLVSPDVVVPAAKVLDSITATTANSITFASAPNVKTGDVLVAGITGKTPQGLMRRVTSQSRKGSATVVRTVPAALDEVFLQAHIDMKDVPLTAFSAPATARSAVAANLATLTVNKTISAKKNALAVSGEFVGTVKATLDVGIDVDLDVSWTGVRGKLRSFRWRVSGTAELSLAGKFTGGGKEQLIVPNAIPEVHLGAVVVSAVPPIVIVPSAGLDLGVRGQLQGTVSLTAKLTTSIGGGFEWRDGRTTNLNGMTVTGSTPDLGDTKVTATASASLFAEPHISASINARWAGTNLSATPIRNVPATPPAFSNPSMDAAMGVVGEGLRHGAAVVGVRTWCADPVEQAAGVVVV